MTGHANAGEGVDYRTTDKEKARKDQYNPVMDRLTGEVRRMAPCELELMLFLPIGYVSNTTGLTMAEQCSLLGLTIDARVMLHVLLELFPAMG